MAYDNPDTSTMSHIAEWLDAKSEHEMADCVAALAFHRDDLHQRLDTARAALSHALTYLGDDGTDDSPEARETRRVIRNALAES